MATPSITYPATNVQGAPYGSDRLVPEGSRYLTDSATAVGTAATELLDKEIMREILDTTPTPFKTLLKLIYAQAPMTVRSREFVTHETGFQFAPAIVNGVAAGEAAVANTFVTEDYVIEATSLPQVGINMIVGFQNGARGTITAINTGTNTITVKSISGGALPAAAVGDKLVLGFGEMAFDGQTGVYNFVRPTTVPRFNYVQQIRVTEKWNMIEQQEWSMNERTNYMATVERKLKERLQFELATNFLNGRRGQYSSTVVNEVARGMHGMFPWMQTYGAGYASVPAAALQATTEAFSHNTNFTDNVIHLCGHQEALNLYSSIYKNQLVQYEPNDQVANLDLQAIIHGGRKFVLVPCNGFRAPGLFEDAWRNRILAYDPSAVKPVKFAGQPIIQKFGPSKTILDGGDSFNAFSVAGYYGMLSFHMGNTEHAWAIDVNDL